MVQKTWYQNQKKNRIKHFIGQIALKIRNLFKPEEVEVTFTDEGHTISYTYTKIEEKKVA